MRQVINLFKKKRIIEMQFSEKKGEICMKVDIFKFILIILEKQVTYLKLLVTNTELQILLSELVLTVKDVLTSFGQSIIIGTVCHYVIEWLDRFIKNFLIKLKKFFTSHKQ